MNEQERVRKRELRRQVRKEGWDARSEQENGAEGNLLNVATKWNGN